MVVATVLCLMVIGSQASAVSWTENWDSGYTVSRELVHSPWVQQINDGSLINPLMNDLDLHVSHFDWWMPTYSGEWVVGQYGYHWGLVSRPTGAGSTDTNVVANFVSFNQSDSAQLFVLSPQANHNGSHWMNVPGSVGLNVDFYTQKVTAFSVNSAGVATSKVTDSSISGWQWWRLVAPKASGAQTVSVEGYSAGAWTAVTTIDVDASFKSDYLGLGMYSAGIFDDVNFSSVPEPGSVLALATGLVGLVGFGIRRRR